MTRLIVLGAGGMLGQAVLQAGQERGLKVSGYSRSDVDITVESDLDGVLLGRQPSTVVNCAAYTDVDGCETNKELARKINGDAVGEIAQKCESSGHRLVHISTDYVFDGTATKPYQEQAETGPRTEYGRSKLVGEQCALSNPASLVVRASWLFGPGGKNFAATISGLAVEREELRVVHDQVGAPTYTPFLAEALLDLVEQGAVGLLHYRNHEACSWFDFATEIVSVWEANCQVVPVTTEEFPRPAPRPAYSVLDVGAAERLLGRPVKAWQEGLRLYRDVLAVERLVS